MSEIYGYTFAAKYYLPVQCPECKVELWAYGDESECRNDQCKWFGSKWNRPYLEMKKD